MLQDIRHPDDILEEQARKARDKARKQTQKQGAQGRKIRSRCKDADSKGV